MAAPKKVDYERIEPGWRAGIKSPAQLASEYTEATGISVSRSAIIKHFTELGVPRDLKAKVRAAAHQAALWRDVPEPAPEPPPPPPEPAPPPPPAPTVSASATPTRRATRSRPWPKA